MEFKDVENMVFRDHELGNEFDTIENSTSVLRSCRFEGIKANGVLITASLVNCTFVDVDWYWGRFSSDRIVNCRFVDCTFSGTTFSIWKFESCEFTRCRFVEDNLGGSCDLDRVKFENCIIEETTGIPKKRMNAREIYDIAMQKMHPALSEFGFENLKRKRSFLRRIGSEFHVIQLQKSRHGDYFNVNVGIGYFFDPEKVDSPPNQVNAADIYSCTFRTRIAHGSGREAEQWSLDECRLGELLRIGIPQAMEFFERSRISGAISELKLADITPRFPDWLNCNSDIVVAGFLARLNIERGDFSNAMDFAEFGFVQAPDSSRSTKHRFKLLIKEIERRTSAQDRGD